jgi:hypothetical protein
MMPSIEMPIRSGAVKQDAIPRPAGGLTRKASLNVVASLLDWSAKLAIGLLVTPVLVGGWSATCTWWTAVQRKFSNF